MQKRRQDQYAGTCKRAFERPTPRSSPPRPGGGRSTCRSRPSSSPRCASGTAPASSRSPLARGQAEIGYGLFFTHEVSEGGLIAKQRAAASAAYSHRRRPSLEGFCKRTNRDDRPEASKPHARAVATLRAETRRGRRARRQAPSSGDDGAQGRRKAVAASAAQRGGRAARRGVAGRRARSQGAAVRQGRGGRQGVYANSYQLALGNEQDPACAAGRASKCHPRRATSRGAAASRPRQLLSARMQLRAADCRHCRPAGFGAGFAVGWELGFCDSNTAGARAGAQRQGPCRAIEQEAVRSGQERRSESCVPTGQSHAAPSAAAAGYTDGFGSYNSVWMLARDVDKLWLPFLWKSRRGRLPAALADAMSIYASRDQAIDEVANLIDALPPALACRSTERASSPRIAWLCPRRSC